MIYTVYVLHSASYNKIYIGFTSDFENRLLSHNHLSKKGWTARYRPWTVIFTEKHATKKRR